MSLHQLRPPHLSPEACLERTLDSGLAAFERLRFILGFDGLAVQPHMLAKFL